MITDNRMELYQQGINDQEIAAIIGKKETAIKAWRRKNNLIAHQKVNVPMEQALTSSQCDKMRIFLQKLISTQNMCPDKRLDINVFILEYRKIYRG